MPASAAKPAKIDSSLPTATEDEPYVPIRLVKRLSYSPSVPVSEIRRIVKKVVLERRAAEAAAQTNGVK
ncbi:MAG: hypothetical protein JNL98_07525 [Bryobacterales bacterium]|nr:hypothetical protein [Bryobacterales bacterium]